MLKVKRIKKTSYSLKEKNDCNNVSDKGSWWLYEQGSFVECMVTYAITKKRPHKLMLKNIQN